MGRLSVLKTYKIFVNGQFPRSESGRYYALKDKKGAVIANVCLCSRKDFRNAVQAARGAFGAWSGKSPFNRGQILYRLAEMLEGRRLQLETELVMQGLAAGKAKEEVSLSVDRLVYYAGWCDKYQHLFSSVNPVPQSFHNYSVPEPMGVVALIAPEQESLLALISVLAPVLAGGNTCVLLASESRPLAAVTFAEALATSDFPAGTVNILTGSAAELHTHFASHMDVNATVYCRGNDEEQKSMEENCPKNVKRFFAWRRDWLQRDAADPYLIMDLQEIKTSWQPVDDHRSGGASY